SFFWVDASVISSSVPWHTKKTLVRDPSPTAAEFSAEAYDFLATHPAPFRKFLEPFLCLVGLSCYYDLDDNVYPTFLTSTGEEMDLFAFIHHADPTKVRIGERQIEEGQVPLLDSTVGRVIALAGEDDQAGPVVQADHDDQNDSIENIGHDDLNEKSGDADQEDRSKGSNHAGKDETATILVDEEIQAAAADKSKGKKKKRRATGGASSSNHPPKKLREDHGTSGNIIASTGGNSLAAIKNLFERSTLNVEVGVAAVATVMFVTSPVTSTPEREGGGNTDSVSGPNLRTQHPSERFVISSDSSHHSSRNAADDEVASLVRSSIPPPLVMIAAVTTAVIAGVSSAPVLGVDAKLVTQVYQSAFADSTSIGVVGPDITGPSNPAGTELSVDTFYSVLGDPDVCRSVVDQLDPLGLFSQLRGMDYDQLFAEFNVGAAHQTCLGAEVRMRSEHNLKERKRFERKCARQVDLLKEKDVEIANLKAQLSLKEAEATEAIRLRSQVLSHPQNRTNSGKVTLG
ncbi:hypothetical protein Tco_1270655, partial [Tanacetum coccineum]